MSGVRVEGLDEALGRIGAEVDKIENVTRAALIEAGVKIMAQAQKNLTKQIYSKGPLGDYRLTGNLRASAYTRWSTRSGGTATLSGGAGLGGGSRDNAPVPSDPLPPIAVEIGFTAAYALYVHENMEGRGAKFLEKVILENEAKIIAIIKTRTAMDNAK